ncbi:uncharacterized protein EDB91DRAFT_1147477 [Suillus paluster]|uniref:uncharacterized protein n=1 Tax=Suillus paluster TaxID=48578 RepID=UPI001B8629BB|nr:uncharacterized protein EDB91DRAFT_1147477 [Suillus paluster]KAG1734087.1 hypothetical protein EDB91DRAFT_1147477 [Suillus paluster]
MKDGLAVIAMSEDSKTLDSFLRFCYPSMLAEDPSFDNLTDVLSALANPKVLETESLRCFAIARNARLKDETIIAAKHSLRQPLIPAWFGEIDLITASDFLALLTYHKNCTIAVHALMKDLQWITDHYGTQSGCIWLFEYCGCGLATDKRFLLWGNAPLLMDRLSGETVRTAAEKTTAKVRSVTNCGACPGRVKGIMAEFSDLLSRKVEEAVAPVCISLYITD